MVTRRVHSEHAWGLVVAGEVPGAPVLGQLVPRGPAVLVIR
jgi:selenide,water dikinase